MWELDNKKGWALKNWCLWAMMLEKTLESPLESKEIKPVNPKGNQPWILIGRTDTEAPILRPSDMKSWLTGKDPDAGKDWRQEDKGTTEDEMVGWHHRFNGHGFEQTPEDGEGQEAWCAAVHGVAKSWTYLSNWTTTTNWTLYQVNFWYVNYLNKVVLFFWKKKLRRNLVSGFLTFSGFYWTLPWN